jgi:hypothetical protein
MLPTKTSFPLEEKDVNLELSLDAQKERLERIYQQNKVGLGWLRFTCSTDYVSYWSKRVKEYFRSDLISRGKGWNGYLESYQGLMGIIIGLTPKLTEAQRQEMGVKRSPNEGYMTVDIPQTALDSLSEVNHYKFLIDVCGCDGLKFTRVDAYYDDYCKIISPEQVHHLCKRGGVAAPRFEKLRGWDEYQHQMGKNYGYTVYFGSNRSEKQIRFYDKFQESDGRQDCYRWEVEVKGNYAQSFQTLLYEAIGASLDAPTLTESMRVMTNFYKSVIRGAIEFHDIPEGKAPKDLPQNWAARTPITWWWDELLVGLEPAKLVLNRVKPSLESAVSWFTSQVVASLAVIRLVYLHWGIPFNSWLYERIEEGEERWSEKHFQMIRDALFTSPAV